MPLLVVAGCAAVALASLALPASPAYDVWAWLVWGREVAHLDLSTVGGPSWKPLPVVVSTLVSVAGPAAPTVWLVLARTAGLLALVGMFRVAQRLAGVVAGVVAALLLLLSPDGEVRYLRVLLEGHTAAVTAALAVWAVESHLSRRPRAVLFLLFLLALDRPEAWPFLLGYALWWRGTERSPLWYPAVLGALIALLWFGGDWWGSGSPWHGADAARVVATQAHRTGDALWRVVDMVPWIAWLGCGWAVVRAVQRRDHVVPVLGALALAWAVLVVAMSAVMGYAALSRFLLPAAAIVCILAGAGTVWAFDALRCRAPVLAVLALVVAVVALGVRASAFPALFEELDRRDGLVHGLDPAIEQAGGTDAILACGAVAISSADVPRVALAWKLDVPMSEIGRSLPDPGGVIFVGDGMSTARREARITRRFGPDSVTLAARSADWAVLSVSCPRT